MEEATVEEILQKSKVLFVEQAELIRQLYRENVELSKQAEELMIENDEMKKKVKLAKAIKAQLDQFLDE